MGQAENAVKNDVQKVLAQCQQYLRTWTNATGVAVYGDRRVKYGLIGSADILGVCRPNGRFVAIELKSNKGKKSDAQNNFKSMVESMGGLYILAQGDDAPKVVLNALYQAKIIPDTLYLDIKK